MTWQKNAQVIIEIFCAKKNELIRESIDKYGNGVFVMGL